jgi:hypothetical protein
MSKRIAGIVFGIVIETWLIVGDVDVNRCLMIG